MVFFDNILMQIMSLNWFIIFSLIYIFLITLYNLLLIIFYNKRIKNFKKYKDPDEILISDFKSLPLVNIIIPAWKEGKIYKNLLTSITELNYPKIRVITNAGGDDQTSQIANSFKNYENFVILQQKEGSDRPSLGKIKALNECLECVSEGIIYIIDADSYLDNEILLRMIYPIINLGEDVVIGGVRPLKSQMKKTLVKYLQFDRFKTLHIKFDRHIKANAITGQNFCINYNVLESIEQFSLQNLIPTDNLIGRDIYSKGFFAYRLVDYRHRIFVDYSNTLMDYFHQRLVWSENFLYKSIKLHYFKNIIKFVFLWMISIYSLLFPFLSILDLRFLFPGILILYTFYLKKIRRIFIFTKAIDKKYYDSYNILFYFYLIGFILFDILITSYVFFHFIYYISKMKKSNLI
jgi:cellulose synthase/poly-beta-1,6-N-acetylglucosamine synthase-like glycosyltransferase